MKNFINERKEKSMGLKYTSLLSGILLYSFTSVAQIQNGGLEQWDDKSGGFGGTFPYRDPVGWTTTNAASMLMSVAVVEREETDVHEGTYAAKLTSKNIPGYGVLPGAIGIVKLNIIARTLLPGAAYTERPEVFSGYYKYTPALATDDAFQAMVHLTKWNSGTNTRDTIGSAVFASPNTVASYTKFEETIVYKSTESPDSITIFITSSMDLENAKNGSIALVDDIRLESTTTGTTKVAALNEAVLLYPNPATHQLYLSELPVNYAFQVLNAAGHVVLEGTTTANPYLLNTSALPAGLYYIKGEGLSKRFVVAE
jgi:hypothetical protein